MKNTSDSNISFDFTPLEREQLLEELLLELEDFYSHTEDLPVSPELDLKQIIKSVRSEDLGQALPGNQAFKRVLDGMKKYTVHTPHPMYYGLYNPRANFAGILADLITAYMNPQLAAWSHSPYANEVEKYIVEVFGGLFGYKEESIDGVFASGGAEANFTAILCALNHTYPDLASDGLQGISQKPRIYCSSETHHSVVRGAILAGLGKNAVCPLASDEQQRIFPERLMEAITLDRQNGYIPVLVVATAGTTGTGAIDYLEQIGHICRKQEIWYHVDAAYGGACIINPLYSHWIKGIELSDSLIMDLHKWFSVPMASSLFITQDPDILHRTFGITTGYMPKDAGDLQITDPFAHSFQWSRRFSGLKIYLSLLMYGLEGFSKMISSQVERAEYLRKELKKHGWSIVNDSPLPVVCFTDEKCSPYPGFAREICDGVVKSGKAWISVYPIKNLEVLRACITNYNTNNQHISSLTGILNELREKYRSIGGSAGKQ